MASTSPSKIPYTLISDNLDKPDIDDRDYKIIKLTNELTVLLIHDPKTDKSAAAMDVNVGSFEDPHDLPGLAHFCEHLLFLGTEKYPSENDYSSYLSKNSGFSNAFTSSQHTNYYFEVSNDGLNGALDRFAQFFIKPLFTPSGKDREINAVDSENKKNLQSDNWRLYQLTKSTANPKHPLNNFSTGNKQTLGDIPISKGVNVRDELIKFHSDHYSSNLMCLSILSNESLDNLTDWTIDMFSSITNKNLLKPFYFESPFNSNNYCNNLVMAKPITETRTLQLTFPIPATTQYWEYLPNRYLSHLIGHESEGSLLFNFKLKGWANSLSCGAHLISSGYSEFTIDIELTEDGLKKYKLVIEDVFKYLKMLASEGLKEWIFKELHDQSISSFKFRQKSGASGTVSRLAGNLHNLSFYKTELLNDIKSSQPLRPPLEEIPPEHLLSLSIVRKFDPSLVKKMLSYLNPNNFRILLISKELFEDVKQPKKVLHEKWYDTEYMIEKFDPAPLLNVQIDPVYRLPDKNDFIPTNFELIESNNSKFPKLIEIDQYSKIWFKSNTELSGPRSSITIKFNLPGSTITPLNSLLLSLFIEILDDELNSISYLASISGLSHSFNIAREGISLEIHGYSHKLEILLEKLIDTLVNFTDPEKIDLIWTDKRKERFEVLKDKMFRNLRNFGLTVPYQQVGPIISSLINENSWLVDDEISCCNAVNFISLRNYATNLFDICFIEVLILGNYTKKDSIMISQKIEKKLNKSTSLTESQFTRGRSLNLNSNSTSHYVKLNDDPENINSCIEIFIQLGLISDNKSRILSELITQVLHEPFFNRLRTVEQLGYVVFSGLRETRTTFGLRFLIQSEKSTNYLLVRIEKFLVKLGQLINKMEIDEFNKHVNAVVSKKEQKVRNLKEEKSRLWNRIATGYYDFDRRENDISILKTLKINELVDYYNENILNWNANGKLVVHLQSRKVPNTGRKVIVKNSILNFVYDRSEFDDVVYEQDKVNKLIDEKLDENIITQGELETLLENDLFNDFPYKKELLNEILENLVKDWTKIDEYEGTTIIDQTGEWKCSIPLTAAPTARIEEEYLDDEVVKGKL